MYKTILCALSMLALTGCSYMHIHRPVIQQGNVITAEETKKLRVGMSQVEVVNVLGTPLMQNIFTPNRIEFVYSYQNGNDSRQETRISCLFENGRLKDIVKSSAN